MERDFRAAARRLEQARDPLTSDAWPVPPAPAATSPAATAKTPKAFIEALQWNLASADAWAELLDYASAVPDIPTLVALFARAPSGVRPRLLRQLLTLSRRAEPAEPVPAAGPAGG